MRHILLVAVSSLFLGLVFTPTSPQAADPKLKNVAQLVRDVSATVLTGRGEGSATLVVRNNRTYALTAGHVVESLRTTREDSVKGRRGEIVHFKDAQLMLVRVINGRSVRTVLLDAEVMRYSDADHGEDLALLRLYDTEFRPSANVKFYLDKDIPEVGAELWHCGSLLGHHGHNSLTAGIISYHGRVFDGQIYDQVQCSIFPGSSGGGVFLKSDGRYVGMVVRGAGEGFGLIVPIRRIQSWSKRVGVEFILDESKTVPSDEVLARGSVEEAGK